MENKNKIQDLNLFKRAYKVVRENSNQIYRGFGFHHLSDVTQYYVHPNNQSFNGTTTLAQPIGEAIILFALMMKRIAEEQPIGDFFVLDDEDRVFLSIDIPSEYRENGVVEGDIFSYRALLEEEKISIAAYRQDGSLIEADMEHLRPLYKLLPIFMVLLASEVERSEDFRILFDSFWEDPVADEFVNLHEDFYQNHKMEEHIIEYRDLSDVDISQYRSYSQRYQVILENKRELKELHEFAVQPFSKEVFSLKQREFIPRLSKEFILSKELNSICNAVSSGDMLSVLLHGPAGTGKTMSCKLICQAIGLPIMETINCTENLDEFVLGKYIPQEEKIIFKESFVTEAIRNGGAVIFEEINFAKPQHLAFLNSLLDDNGFVRLDNGEVVKRSPHFRFFATMNLGYFGTKELNQALYNRFNGIVEISSLADEDILRMLTMRVPECTSFAPKMLSVYHKLKKKFESEELDIVISPRNLENWARLAKYEGYIKSAEKTIIPVAKCDRAVEESIRGILMLYKWQ